MPPAILWFSGLCYSLAFADSLSCKNGHRPHLLSCAGGSWARQLLKVFVPWEGVPHDAHVWHDAQAAPRCLRRLRRPQRSTARTACTGTCRCRRSARDTLFEPYSPGGAAINGTPCRKQGIQRQAAVRFQEQLMRNAVWWELYMRTCWEHPIPVSLMFAHNHGRCQDLLRRGRGACERGSPMSKEMVGDNSARSHTV